MHQGRKFKRPPICGIVIKTVPERFDIKRADSYQKSNFIRDLQSSIVKFVFPLRGKLILRLNADGRHSLLQKRQQLSTTNCSVSPRRVSFCENWNMGSRFLWDVARKTLTVGLCGLVVSDRYASSVTVRGLSMSPTFNPSPNTCLGLLTDDRVLLSKLCLKNYRFTHGDIIAFRSPSNQKERQIKRIVALPGDWISVPSSHDVVRIPEGHCWVEGDNPTCSLDSRSCGPIPLALIQGKVTHIIWPPHRVGKVEQKMPEGRLLPH